MIRPTASPADDIVLYRSDDGHDQEIYALWDSITEGVRTAHRIGLQKGLLIGGIACALTAWISAYLTLVRFGL